ncbi:MAG TPA: hypothetical protein VFH61_18615 [Thermoleophilia bacterium]|nr:hypothetical protein [Thermoleophilia bacterium]
MPLFDFVCEARHRTELLRSVAVHEVECPVCGQTAARGEVNLVSMQMGADANWSPLVRDDGHIRTPVGERRVKMGAYLEASAEEADRAERTGQPSPPAAAMGVARARKMMKAGVNDSLDAK